MNAKVTVFVFVTTNQHNEDWLTRFSRVIGEFPEVVEFYRMSGQIDYLLKVVVPDIEAYDAFYKKLVSKIDIMDVSSAFAMETSRTPPRCRSATCSSSRWRSSETDRFRGRIAKIS